MKKFEDKYTGPFYVRDKGPYDTYKIADCRNDKCVKNFINAQDLKRYYDPQNYRYEPPEDDIYESESDAATIIYDPNENDDNELEVNRDSTKNETGKNEHHTEQTEGKKNKKVPKGKWYSVNKILRQRKVGPTKQFLLEWSDVRFKPSWEDEDKVSEKLKRQFYIRHTKLGKRRKRPYKYFN